MLSESDVAIIDGVPRTDTPLKIMRSEIARQRRAAGLERPAIVGH
jgi:hypothetical protein